MSPPNNIRICVPIGFASQLAQPPQQALPNLDTIYPYSSGNPPGTPTTRTNDSPNTAISQSWGEYAQSFHATMYLLWTPSPTGFLPACPNGVACTVPIPLGSVNWQFGADPINTLAQQTSNNTTWLFNYPQPGTSGVAAPQGFQVFNFGSSPSFPFDYPTWTNVVSTMQDIDDPAYYSCVSK